MSTSVGAREHRSQAWPDVEGLRAAPHDPEDNADRRYTEPDQRAVVVLGDFTGRLDRDPFIADRLRAVRRGGLDDALRAHRVPIRREGAETTADSWADLRYADVEVQRMWWALRWLLDWSVDIQEVRMLDARKTEIVADLRDGRSLLRSCLGVATSRLNHPGMEPAMMLVIGFPLHRREDATLLENLAELGRLRNLAVFAPTAEDLSSEELVETEASLSAHPGARFVSLVGPDVVQRTSEGPMRAPASFLLAILACRAWAEHRFGRGLRDGIPGVELASPVAPSQAILAASRGLLSFVATPGGAALVADATLASTGLARSMSWTLLFARLALEAVRVHYRRMGERLCADLSAEGTARLLSRGLATRFANAEHVHVELEDARWVVPPELWGASDAPSLNRCGQLAVTLCVRLSVDRPEHTVETVREPCVLLFDT